MPKTNSIDVCITFDTTGSMYPCLTQVRRYVDQTVKRLFKDIPDLRIAIIAHGDYCDAGNPYVTEINDFSTNVDNISKFVKQVKPTFGGDAPECYELVLRQARTSLNWQSGRAKIIVMIGDATPHEPSYPQNVDNIDYRNELGLIKEAGINIYGVHAMPGIREYSKYFYHELAKGTDGLYLTLDQFSYITELIMGICYKQESPEMLGQFEMELVNDKRMTRTLQRSFDIMVGREVEEEYVPPPPRKRGETSSRVYKYSFEEDGLTPVPSGRFQVMPVDREINIKDFIQEQRISFNIGRGFYELVRYGKKRYKVQQYKEIILMDRDSGDLFHGMETRRLLGLQPQIEGGKGSGVTETIPPKSLDRYRVFIQSTSHNRKLVPDSNLLYEVDDWDIEK